MPYQEQIRWFGVKGVVCNESLHSDHVGGEVGWRGGVAECDIREGHMSGISSPCLALVSAHSRMVAAVCCGV